MTVDMDFRFISHSSKVEPGLMVANRPMDSETLPILLKLSGKPERMLFRAFNVARRVFVYNREMVKKNKMYTNVFGRTWIVTKLITAHRLVKRPVLIVNTISLLITVSERS